jgi:transposase
MRKAQSPAALGFTGHDRRRLAKALHQAQEAKVYRRIQAVLLIAQGYSVDEVASIIGGRRRAVYYWMHRYLDHHRVDDLCDASRTGRPWMKLGYNTTVWTVPLLASHLSRRYHSQITPRTLRRRMKEIGLRWKRPRHFYAAKDPA